MLYLLWLHVTLTMAKMVVLPLLTTIRPGGGGTALLRGSHRLVAARLQQGACTSSISPREIAISQMRALGAAAAVEATGQVPYLRPPCACTVMRPHHALLADRIRTTLLHQCLCSGAGCLAIPTPTMAVLST